MTTVVGLDLSLRASGLARITWDALPAGMPTDLRVPARTVAETWMRGKDGITALPYRQRVEAMDHIAADVLAYADSSDLVVIEEPVTDPRSTSTWERGYLWYRVVGRLLGRGQSLVVATPSQLKKWATGRGNVSKVAVGVAIGRVWTDAEVGDDNRADALTAASLAVQLLGGPLPCEVTAYRREVAAKLSVIEAEAA